MLNAQQGTVPPVWQTLARSPLPDGVEPTLSINSLVLPAGPASRPVQPHSHPGPVIAYIVEGEIENQVEPELPIVHRPGGFFLEPPTHAHKVLRNLSATERAMLIVAQVGRTGVPEALTKPLAGEPVQLLRFHFGEPAPPHRYQFKVPLGSTARQEFRVARLTLPPSATVDVPTSGTAVLFVLGGTIATATPSGQGNAYTSGDLFLRPGPGTVSVRNTGGAPASLLLYQATDTGADHMR